MKFSISFRYAAWPYCGTAAGRRPQGSTLRRSPQCRWWWTTASAFWKWKNILKMKAHSETHSENEICFTLTISQMRFLNIVHSGLYCYCVLSKMLYLSNKSGKLPLFSLSLSQNCHARLVSFCAKGEGRVLFSFLGLIKVVYSQFIYSYCLFPL